MNMDGHDAMTRQKEDKKSIVIRFKKPWKPSPSFDEAYGRNLYKFLKATVVSRAANLLRYSDFIPNFEIQ